MDTVGTDFRRGNKKDDVTALWARSTKNPDVSTGPFSRSFPRLLASLTGSLAPPCLLCSRAPLRSLICSLVGKWMITDQMTILSVFILILDHSALVLQVGGSTALEETGWRRRWCSFSSSLMRSRMGDNWVKNALMETISFSTDGPLFRSCLLHLLVNVRPTQNHFIIVVVVVVVVVLLLLLLLLLGLLLEFFFQTAKTADFDKKLQH